MVDFQLVPLAIDRGKIDLEPIKRHFHDLIRDRCGHFLSHARIDLPGIDELAVSFEMERWLPLPEPLGGLTYRLDLHGNRPRLLVGSHVGKRLEPGPRYIVSESSFEAVEEISSLVWERSS